MRLLLCSLGILLVGTVHVSIGTYLYGRAIAQHDVCDITVFYIPTVIALGAYGWLVWSSGVLAGRSIFRFFVAGTIALLAALTSLLCMMTVAFSRYGS